MCLFELWFSQSICPAVGLLGILMESILILCKYMASRKMGQGRKRDGDIEDGCVYMGEEGRVEQIGRVGLTHMHTHRHCHLWNRQLVGTSYIVQGAQRSALWWLWWVGWGLEGGPRGRGYMYAYSWFTLLYSRNEYNVVKQLDPNKNKQQWPKKKKKMSTSQTSQHTSSHRSGSSLQIAT